MTEQPEKKTPAETPEDALARIKAIQAEPDKVLRVESHWYIEQLMPVAPAPDADPDQEPEDDTAPHAWMMNGPYRSDREEHDRVVEFWEKNNPEDRIRTVRVDSIHTVEDADG